MAVPPISKVAATTASAVRGRVRVPAFDFMSFTISSQTLDSIATYVASGTPAPLGTGPFDSAMRHKRGSRVGLSHPETSCDMEHNIIDVP